MSKLNVMLFVVLAVIINTTVLFGAKMTANFTINGQSMRGTIEADRIFANGHNVTTEPCNFTFTPSGGQPVQYPCGTVVTFSATKTTTFTDAGLEVLLDFNSTEGFIVNSNGDYAVEIYELASAGCVYSSSTRSNITSIRDVFVENNLSTNIAGYVIQVRFSDGIVITQKFMFVENQFIRGTEW